MPARRRVIAALTAALVWPAAAHGQSPGLLEADSRFVALFAKGRFQEALPFAERALELSEREFGPDHPEVAAKLNSLAEVYRAQGKFFVAEALHLRALEIREKALRPDDPALAQSIDNLAKVYRARCPYARVGTLRKRASAIDRDDEAWRGLWECYMAAGDTAFRRGEFDEAEIRYDGALETVEGFAAEGPHLATSLNNLAELHRARGRFAEAERLHIRALAIRENVLGPGHAEVATSLNNLAALYHAQHKFIEAEPLYRRALAIYETTLGSEHPRVALSLINLAEMYRARTEYARAEPLYRRALAIQERAFGPEHPEVAASLNYLALLNYDQARFADAAEWWRRAAGQGHAEARIRLDDMRERGYGAVREEEAAETRAARETGQGDAIAEALSAEPSAGPAVAPEAPAEDIAAAPEAPAAAGSRGAPYVALEDANVRAAPNPKARRVGVLLAGEAVTAIGAAGGEAWLHVAQDGAEFGYVWAPLLGPAREPGSE